MATGFPLDSLVSSIYDPILAQRPEAYPLHKPMMSIEKTDPTVSTLPSIYPPFNVNPKSRVEVLDKMRPVELDYFLCQSNTLVVLKGGRFYNYKMNFEDTITGEGEEDPVLSSERFLPISRLPYVFVPGWAKETPTLVWAISSTKRIYETTLRRVLRGRIDANLRREFHEVRRAVLDLGFNARKTTAQKPAHSKDAVNDDASGALPADVRKKPKRSKPLLTGGRDVQDEPGLEKDGGDLVQEIMHTEEKWGFANAVLSEQFNTQIPGSDS